MAQSHTIIHKQSTSCTQIVYKSYTNSLQVVHKQFTSRTQAVHRSYTNSTQVVHKLFTNSLQIVHKQSTTCTQIVYQPYTNSLQVVHKLYTSRTQVVHKFDVIPSVFILAANIKLFLIITQNQTLDIKNIYISRVYLLYIQFLIPNQSSYTKTT